MLVFTLNKVRWQRYDEFAQQATWAVSEVWSASEVTTWSGNHCAQLARRPRRSELEVGAALAESSSVVMWPA